MNESRLRTIEQLREFLDATPQVQFSAHGGDGDSQRYKHISAVLRRLTTLGAPRLIAASYGPIWCAPRATAARN